MGKFVDKVKKNGVEYEIQDARVPEVVAEDYDKYLHVNADTGALEYAEVQGGGEGDIFSGFYFDLTNEGHASSTSVKELFDLFGAEVINADKVQYFPVNIRYSVSTPYPHETGLKGLLTISAGGPNGYSFTIYEFGFAVAFSRNAYCLTANLESTSIDELLGSLNTYLYAPALPNDVSEKTYVLKAVNGTLTWVEEQA